MKKKKPVNETIIKEEISTENTVENTSEKTQQNIAVTELSVEELLTIEKDKNLRLFAEFENLRKRTAKDRLELMSSANKDLLTVLLPVLDNFERWIKTEKYSEETGPSLIFKQLVSELERKGLQVMADPIGKELDTDFHEAIAHIPAPSKDNAGKIIDIVEKGYLLSGKVLRYAKVVVANKE